MSFALASLIKDLARWRRDPMALLIWLGIPFLVGGLISMLSTGQGSGPSGRLLIADEDDTFLSGLVAGIYSQQQLGELIIAEAVTPEDGRRRIEAGEASAFLTIPAGFQDAFLEETPVTLTLVTNPAQRILPGIIEDVTEVLLDAGFYAQRLLGPEIEKIRNADDGVRQDAFVAGISVDIRNKIDRIAPKLSPPVFDIEFVEPPPEEPRPDVAVLFIPGITLMALLLASNGLAADFWDEREKGTLRRLASAPGVMAGFVAGKALAAFAVSGGLAGLTLAAGFIYNSLDWVRFPPALLWGAIAGVGLFAWFATLQMLFESQQAANLTTTILLLPLMMAGGSFFPLEAMPDWMAAIGRFSPNGFVVDRLTTDLTSEPSWSYALSDWGLLVAATAAGLALCTWRLAARFARA